MITITAQTAKDRNTVEAGGGPGAVPFGGVGGAVAPQIAVGGASTVAAPLLGGAGGVVAPSVSTGSAGSDWSASNRPWAYTSTSQFTAPSRWAGANIVNIQTGGADFLTNLTNTVNAAGARCVVRLSAGTYHLTAFNLIGSSGDPSYAFGFWFPNLQGFLGAGPDQTIIQMDANSMTTAQLNKLATMTIASFSPNQMGLCRLDGSSSSPVLLAGVRFRSQDQQNLTAVASDVASAGIVVPQPAPHQGVVLYYAASSDIGFCAFIGAGRAMNSQPPFEQANLSTQTGDHLIHNTEFDGRRDVAVDAAQPRRCGPLMGNGETSHVLTDVWAHHSNVSRYAMNDQNVSVTNAYSATRTKLEQITNQQNVDPALNGGVSLGGWTNASPFGWESTKATITINNSIISVDNANTSGQFATHFQFTAVGSGPVDPAGGRFHAQGNTYRNSATSQLDGYCTVRIAMNCHWWTDGPATTLDIRDASGTALTGYSVTGSWPPSAATLTAAGVSPTTHYLYKGI